VGENWAFASATKRSGIILDFIKKVMLIFGFSESPWTSYVQPAARGLHAAQPKGSYGPVKVFAVSTPNTDNLSFLIISNLIFLMQVVLSSILSRLHHCI